MTAVGHSCSYNIKKDASFGYSSFLLTKQLSSVYIGSLSLPDVMDERCFSVTVGKFPSEL